MLVMLFKIKIYKRNVKLIFCMIILQTDILNENIV